MAPIKREGTLVNFWKLLESLPGGQLIEPFWQQHLGSDFEIARRWLRPTDELGTCYPCPIGAAWEPHGVVTLGPNRHVAIDHHCVHEVELTDADLVVYELDRKQMMTQIAESLGLPVRYKFIDDTFKAYQIGMLNPVSGYYFYAYLVMSPDSRCLAEAVMTLLSHDTTPFLLLTPTSQMVRPACQMMLDQRGCAHMALWDALEWKEDALVATPGWHHLNEQFIQRHVPDAKSAARPEFFPTPAETRWSDLSINFVDNHTVSVRVGKVAQQMNYTQMGMVDRRTGGTNRQWDLLYVFAMERGTFTWDSRHANNKWKKQKELLSATLKSFFRIEGEPFAVEGTGWRARFHIEADH